MDHEDIVDSTPVFSSNTPNLFTGTYYIEDGFQADPSMWADPFQDAFVNNAGMLNYSDSSTTPTAFAAETILVGSKKLADLEIIPQSYFWKWTNYDAHLQIPTEMSDDDFESSAYERFMEEAIGYRDWDNPYFLLVLDSFMDEGEDQDIWVEEADWNKIQTTARWWQIYDEWMEDRGKDYLFEQASDDFDWALRNSGSLKMLGYDFEFDDDDYYWSMRQAESFEADVITQHRPYPAMWTGYPRYFCWKCGDPTHHYSECKSSKYDEALSRKKEMLKQVNAGIKLIESYTPTQWSSPLKDYDLECLRELRRMIKNNHFGIASHYFNGLDTNVRDHIGYGSRIDMWEVETQQYRSEEGDNPDWDEDGSYDPQAAWESIWEDWLEDWMIGEANEDVVDEIAEAVIKNDPAGNLVIEDNYSWYLKLSNEQREDLLTKPYLSEILAENIDSIAESWDDQFMSEGTGDPYELSPQEALMVCEAGGCVYLKDYTDQPDDYDSFDYPTEDPDDIRMWIEEGLFDGPNAVTILSDPRPIETAEAPKSLSKWQDIENVVVEDDLLIINLNDEGYVVVGHQDIQEIIDEGWELDTVRWFKDSGGSILFTRAVNCLYEDNEDEAWALATMNEDKWFCKQPTCEFCEDRPWEYRWNNNEKVLCCCGEPTRDADFCPEGGYNRSGDECKLECGHEECEAQMKAKYGAESFEARGTWNLYKSQEKVLKAYRDSGGKENDYDSLPIQVVNKLESIRNSETLWSDVNRWLSDNPSTSKNPYGGFHSSWDAESFSADEELGCWTGNKHEWVAHTWNCSKCGKLREGDEE